MRVRVWGTNKNFMIARRKAPMEQMLPQPSNFALVSDLVSHRRIRLAVATAKSLESSNRYSPHIKQWTGSEWGVCMVCSGSGMFRDGRIRLPNAKIRFMGE
jgi:hypothetical protein